LGFLRSEATRLLLKLRASCWKKAALSCKKPRHSEQEQESESERARVSELYPRGLGLGRGTGIALVLAKGFRG
jgi:hypothetical protein